MTNTQTPWNKGLTGLAAGWTPARRKKMSIKQKRWLRRNPDSPVGQKGPRKGLWLTGPDPKVHKHYYRFLKAKAQAKFWKQKWTIMWEDYLDFFKTMHGRWGRGKKSKNLCRINTNQGWHIWNVQMMVRGQAMRRPTKNKRIKPKGKGSKARGINWRRGGHVNG